MKAPKSFLLALAMIMASAGFAAAQSSIEVKPGASRPTTNLINEQDNEIVNEVFSPITGRLNLTAAQKFRTIIADAVHHLCDLVKRDRSWSAAME